MSDITNNNSSAINSDDPILRRSGRFLGQEWQSAKGIDSDNQHRIYIDITIPLHHSVQVHFARKPLNEVHS